MDIQQLFAERIGGARFGTTNAVFKFQKIKNAKAAAQKNHPGIELLDFGVGEPDRMAPAPIRKALKVAVDKPENRGYADNGIDEFKASAGEYMAKFFHVNDLEPAAEINHSIGSKPALAMLPLAFVNPGDTILSNVPGYPVLATHAQYLGGKVVNIPLTKANDFFPDLAAIDPRLWREQIAWAIRPNQRHSGIWPNRVNDACCRSETQPRQHLPAVPANDSLPIRTLARPAVAAVTPQNNLPCVSSAGSGQNNTPCRSRSAAISHECSSLSIPITRWYHRLAASGVEPLPMNGSSSVPE